MRYAPRPAFLPATNLRCVHGTAARITVRSPRLVRRENSSKPSGGSDRSEVSVVRAGAGAAARAEHPSAAVIARVVNWAYRGKHVDGDRMAWTGERHLLVGKRTTADEIEELLERCDAPQPSEQLLLALDKRTGRASSTDLLGTVHVQKLPQCGECEIGMFSVDPDVQGRGLGGLLLRHAERIAADSFEARTLVMHVLEGRSEIQDWYERCGYSAVPDAPKLPFPFGHDALSAPLVPKDTLNFLRLEKVLQKAAESPAGYPFEDYETAAQYEREEAWIRGCQQKRAEERQHLAVVGVSTGDCEQDSVAEIRRVAAVAHKKVASGGVTRELLQAVRSQPSGSSTEREELYKVAIDECVLRLQRREALELFEVRFAFVPTDFWSMHWFQIFSRTFRNLLLYSMIPSQQGATLLLCTPAMMLRRWCKTNGSNWDSTHTPVEWCWRAWIAKESVVANGYTSFDSEFPSRRHLPT